MLQHVSVGASAGEQAPDEICNVATILMQCKIKVIV